MNVENRLAPSILYNVLISLMFYDRYVLFAAIILYMFDKVPTCYV